MRTLKLLTMAVWLLLGSSAHAITVQTELMLLCDISGSISTTEFNLQKTGYENAFRSAAVQNLVSQATGGIAVSMVWWSGASQQAVAVDWTHVFDASSCNALATQIHYTTRPYNGLTAPGSAIAFGTPKFWNNSFTSRFQIMDVSGDGTQNDGLTTHVQRDLALQAGIDRINGLAIESQSVKTWYVGNVQGGQGAFTLFASNFETFGSAIEQKILREVNPIPEPSTIALLGLGLLASGGVAIRRRRG